MSTRRKNLCGKNAIDTLINKLQRDDKSSKVQLEMTEMVVDIFSSIKRNHPQNYVLLNQAMKEVEGFARIEWGDKTVCTFEELKVTVENFESGMIREFYLTEA